MLSDKAKKTLDRMVLFGGTLTDDPYQGPRVMLEVPISREIMRELLDERVLDRIDQGDDFVVYAVNHQGIARRGMG